MFKPIMVNTPKKQQTGSSTGLLMGLIFGFLVGLSMFKTTLPSERSFVFPYAIGIGIVLSALFGYKIGAENDKQNYRDECLGIKNIITNYSTENGNWAIESYWKAYDGKEYRILTTAIDREVVTIYNEIIIATHGYALGKISTSKLHEEIKADVVQRLKNSFVG